MSRTAVQIPGDAAPITDVKLPALNNADADPDRVAAEREALTQSRAASAAVERGDLAGAQKILADAQAAIAAASVPEVYVESHSVDLSTFGEGVMAVSVPVVRRSAIVEKFGDDRQKMQMAMMDLYKKEKINPMGGCFPILIQIPVFIALYWVLLGSVELRHAPFFGWIKDLSAIDPYYILPILMGSTMIIQTKLNPKPTDPMQAKVMTWMPVVFSVFFFFFPAGLVLYWLVNNVLSIAQQWYVNKMIHAENLLKKQGNHHHKHN